MYGQTNRSGRVIESQGALSVPNECIIYLKKKVTQNYQRNSGKGCGGEHLVSYNEPSLWTRIVMEAAII